MDLDELRDVCRAERQRDSLQHLQETFYRDVAAYIADLKTERERAAEAADDPFSAPEVRRLTDEIESAEKLVESIYKRRVGKVIERASFAADGTTHDDEGLTDEERDLFDDLVARIERNRERVLDAVDPAAADADADADADANADADAVVQPDAPEADADRRREAAPPSDGGDAPDPSDLLSEAMGGADGSPPSEEPAPDPPGATADVDADADAEGEANASGPPTADGGAPAASTGTEPHVSGADTGDANAPAPPAPTPGAAATDGPAPERTRNGAGAPDGTDTADGGVGDAPARRTVYVTRDVGEIYGADGRTYRLLSEDVVDLPADNARALVERDAAEPLGGGAD